MLTRLEQTCPTSLKTLVPSSEPMLLSQVKWHVLAIPALGRGTQANPWDLLVSQLGQIGDSQASERLYPSKKNKMPGIMVHVFDPNTWMAIHLCEFKVILDHTRILDQSALHVRLLSQKKDF